MTGVALSAIFIACVIGSLGFSAVLIVTQMATEHAEWMKLRRLKYSASGKAVELARLDDPQAFHLFLSHAWPAAQE